MSKTRLTICSWITYQAEHNNSPPPTTTKKAGCTYISQLHKKWVHWYKHKTLNGVIVTFQTISIKNRLHLTKTCQYMYWKWSFCSVPSASMQLIGLCSQQKGINDNGPHFIANSYSNSQIVKSANQAQFFSIYLISNANWVLRQFYYLRLFVENKTQISISAFILFCQPQLNYRFMDK